MTTNFAPLMTPEETADYLRVSKETLAAWRCTDREPLPFVKVGSLVRYRTCDVAAVYPTFGPPEWETLARLMVPSGLNPALTHHFANVGYGYDAN